jgi:hypothetical protein
MIFLMFSGGCPENHTLSTEASTLSFRHRAGYHLIGNLCYALSIV